MDMGSIILQIMSNYSKGLTDKGLSVVSPWIFTLKGLP